MGRTKKVKKPAHAWEMSLRGRVVCRCTKCLVRYVRGDDGRATHFAPDGTDLGHAIPPCVPVNGK